MTLWAYREVAASMLLAAASKTGVLVFKGILGYSKDHTILHNTATHCNALQHTLQHTKQT